MNNTLHSAAMNALGFAENDTVVISSNSDILQTINIIAQHTLKHYDTGLSTLEDAKHFLGFYKIMHTSKDGRVIKKNEHRKHFSKKKLPIDKLFEVALRGEPKKRLADGFIPTDLCQTIIAEIYELFSALHFSDSHIDFDPTEMIKVSPDVLSQISYGDRNILLHNLVTYTGANFIVTLNRDEKDGNGRVYSVFVQISAETRKLLGYINYDMDAAMQTIILQLVANSAAYPLHQELVRDKRAFRKRFAEDANITINEAKTLLTSLDNKTTFNGGGIIGKAYVAEAVSIHLEVLQRIKTDDPILYTRCEELAKYGKYDTVKEQKNSYSIYFHIWTHYEKLIRDAMKSCFSEPEMVIDVHDAVYSKENIDTTVLEKVVLETTGFKVKISTD